MKARTRALATTLLLVAVAAGVVLAAWFGVGRRDEAAAARRSSEAKLFSFTPGDVTAVTVTAKGDATRVVRRGDGWHIESPVSADADGQTVTSLVDRVADLRRTAAVGDGSPEARTRYGLEKPRATVALTLKDGRSESLALGDDNPFDQTVFVATGSGAVALVPGDLKWTLERSTFDLRDKTVLRFERDAVATVRIRRPGTELEVRRDTAPERLSSTLWTLSSLRASAFVDERGTRAAELGLDRPTLAVTLIGKDGKELARLAVSAPRGGVTYARGSGSGPVVRIEPSSLESLPKTEQDTHDPKPPQPSAATPAQATGSGSAAGTK